MSVLLCVYSFVSYIVCTVLHKCKKWLYSTLGSPCWQRVTLNSIINITQSKLDIRGLGSHGRISGGVSRFPCII